MSLELGVSTQHHTPTTEWGGGEEEPKCHECNKVHDEGQETSKHVLGEVVNCVVYLLNRTTSRSTGDCTPYELWTGSKANVSHLRVFGCIAHVKTTAPNLKKLDDRIKPMILLVMNQDQLLIDAMIQTPNMFTSAGTSYLMKKGSGIGHQHK
jgi:hypothetical protein